MSSRLGQLLKFLTLIVTVLLLYWWLEAYNVHPYEVNKGSYTKLHQTVWILFALATASGIIHVIAYSLISNRSMFIALKLQSILLLTIGSSLFITGFLIEWRILDYLSKPDGVVIFYYPSVSVAAVLGRYSYFRKNDRLVTENTDERSVVTNLS